MNKQTTLFYKKKQIVTFNFGFIEKRERKYFNYNLFLNLKSMYAIMEETPFYLVDLQLEPIYT